MGLHTSCRLWGTHGNVVWSMESRNYLKSSGIVTWVHFGSPTWSAPPDLALGPNDDWTIQPMHTESDLLSAPFRQGFTCSEWQGAFQVKGLKMCMCCVKSQLHWWRTALAKSGRDSGMETEGGQCRELGINNQEVHVWVPDQSPRSGRSLRMFVNP